MSIEQIERRTTRLAGVPSKKRNGLTLRDCESGTPLVSEDIETDAAVGVDVGMVDARGEVHLGRLERVVGGEVNRQEEDTSGVWGVTLIASVSVSRREWDGRPTNGVRRTTTEVKNLQDP